MKKILMLNVCGNEQEDFAFVRVSLGALGLDEERIMGGLASVELLMQNYIGSYEFSHYGAEAVQKTRIDILPVCHSVCFSSSESQQALTSKTLSCYAESEKHSIASLEAGAVKKSTVARRSCETFFLAEPEIDPIFLLLDTSNIEEHYDALSQLLRSHFQSKVLIPIVVGNLNRLIIGLLYKMLRDVGVRLSDASDYSMDDAQFITSTCFLYEELLPANQAMETEYELASHIKI